jgi:Mce-associated membrane protein
MSSPDGEKMRWYRSAGAGLVLLVLAAAFLGWSGWSYWQSGHSGSVRFAKARDQVRLAGRQEIATLNTLDPQQSDAGLRRWLDASTGPLRDELRRTSAENKQKIEQAQVAAVGTVTDLAVTELDARAGTAQVIATVQVKVGASEPGRKRFIAVLARTGGDWKLTSLTAVPAGAS